MNNKLQIALLVLIVCCICLVRCQADDYTSDDNAYTCNGIAPSDDTVCSGHGSCESQDQCECHSDYTGQYCDVAPPPKCDDGYSSHDGNCVPVCYSVAQNEGNVCSSHGSCNGPDQCQCNEGWSGNDCSQETPTCDSGYSKDSNDQCVPVCYGTLASESCCVCSGHGECSGPDSCQCSSGFSGQQCEITETVCDEGYQKNENGDCVPVCYGTISGDTSICNGHGSCSGPDSCECNEGWSGDQCNEQNCDSGYQKNDNGECVPVCYEVLQGDDSVCSGHGECSNPNQCQCHDSWTGEQCDQQNCDSGYQKNDNNECVPICYEVPYGDDTACNGHGNCSAPDSCECNEGWSGDQCDQQNCDQGYQKNDNEECVPVCYEIPYGDDTVCNGHGNCSAPDSCECNEGWSGDQCADSPTVCDEGYQKDDSDQCIPVCYDTLATDESVCSSHGNCSAPNSCECHEGWTGDSCDTSDTPETPTCYDIPSDDDTVCSGHGTCDAKDSCTCSDGWSGDSCDTSDTPETPTCYDIPSDDDTVCSGHGTCESKDSCTCSDGWSGDACDTSDTPETPICYDIPADDDTVCSGHGTCDAKDSCSCTDGWTGDSCDTSDTPETPSCFDIPAGDETVCSGHGTCDATDSCSCQDEWSGNDCSEPVTPELECFGISANDSSVCSGYGECIDLDTCQCDDLHTGPDCAQVICQCVYGSCDENGNCTCEDGWGGDYCDAPTCNGIPADDPSCCSGHGACVEPEVCACDSRYVGDYCDVPTCFYLPKDHPHCCSGHGQCGEYNKCQCQDDWLGTNCEKPKNCGCGSHGKCKDGDSSCKCECECDEGYEGDKCQYAICQGKTNKDKTCCGGKGNCYQPQTCGCKYGYGGETCDNKVPPYKFTCYGIPSSSNGVCSGHGMCVAKDTCYCAFGYGGKECQCKGDACNAGTECTCTIEGDMVFTGSKICACKVAESWNFNNGTVDYCAPPEEEAPSDTTDENTEDNSAEPPPEK